MRQHFISQFIIKKWLEKDTNYLNVYDIQKNVFIDKKSKNPLSSKGVFSSAEITEHNKIFNEAAEDEINKSNIEKDASEIINSIIGGNTLNQNKINILGKYFQLYSLLYFCYYWPDRKTKEDKLNKYVSEIINQNTGNTNFLVMRKKTCDDDIILSINAFSYKYGNVVIYPISPEIIIALGDELNNEEVTLSSSKLAIFNSDFAKIDIDYENKIKRFPYIVFRNNSRNSIVKLLEKPRQGLKIFLRIDEEQTLQVKKQGQQWEKGEYLLLPGERDKNNCKLLTPFKKYF
jgi:hypothetical protein